MAHRTRIASRVVAVFLATIALAAPVLAAAPQVDQFIVKFKPVASGPAQSTTRQSLLAGIGRAHGLQLRVQRPLAVGAELVRSDRALHAAEAAQLLSRLRRDPRVEYADVDALLQPAFTPDDPYYAWQSNLSDPGYGIRAPQAWDLSSGLGVVVAVLDSGFVAHGDLNANLVPGYDFIVEPAIANDGDGRDADAHDPGNWTVAGQCFSGSPATASTWHGTVVAGVVAAQANNAVGMAGVAFRSKVMPLRVSGRCGARMSDIVDAIAWAAGGPVPGIAANANPVEVINLSTVAAGACPAALQASIDGAVAAGAVVVVAAGNNAADATGYHPGNCANVVNVGASWNYGFLADYSNRGPGLDLTAPGGYWIYGTGNNGTTVPAQPIIQQARGTSLAAAHVAGVAALMQAHQPSTPARVEAVLKATARIPTNNDLCANACGSGLLDASLAVRGAKQPLLLIEAPGWLEEGTYETKRAVFNVRLTEPLATPVQYDVATVDGTATAGSDYVARTVSGLVFAPGETRRLFAVDLVRDSVHEPDETFRLVASNITGATLLDVRNIATIRNDDRREVLNGVPITGVSGGPWSAEEWFRMIVPPGAYDLVVSATGGTGSYTLQAWSVGPECTTGKDLPPCVIANPMGMEWGLYLEGWNYAGVTITATWKLSKLTVGDVEVVEGDAGTKTATITVHLARPTLGEVRFDAATIAGSAAEGVDFVAQQWTNVTIPWGETTARLVVTTVGDTEVEPNEHFRVALQATNGPQIDNGQGNVIVLNNDGPTLRAGNVAIAEGDAGTKLAVFTVELSQAATVPVTYSISTGTGTAQPGVDFAATSLVGETIPAGMLARTFAVPIHGDTTVEGTESFSATITAATGASILHPHGRVYILNDDGPALSILDKGVVEGASGTRVMLVTVRLSQPATVPVTYSLATANGTATAGSDYVARTLSGLTIPAGETSRQHQFVVNGDTAVEANETFLINLTNVTGATRYDWQAIATIHNDDGPTLSVNDVTISEGNSGTKVATFTVFLSQVAPMPISYDIATSDLTATAGSDFVATALVGETIPAGQLSKTFTVTLNGDTNVEANETFRVMLSNIGAGATLFKYIGTGTITDDD